MALAPRMRVRWKYSNRGAATVRFPAPEQKFLLLERRFAKAPT